MFVILYILIYLFTIIISLFQTSCIKQLDARCCTVLDQVMPVLGRAIRMGAQVAVLHLENSVASGRPLMILGR